MDKSYRGHIQILGNEYSFLFSDFLLTFVGKTNAPKLNDISGILHDGWVELIDINLNQIISI